MKLKFRFAIVVSLMLSSSQYALAARDPAREDDEHHITMFRPANILRPVWEFISNPFGLFGVKSSQVSSRTNNDDQIKATSLIEMLNSQTSKEEDLKLTTESLTTYRARASEESKSRSSETPQNTATQTAAAAVGPNSAGALDGLKKIKESFLDPDSVSDDTPDNGFQSAETVVLDDPLVNIASVSRAESAETMPDLKDSSIDEHLLYTQIWINPKNGASFAIPEVSQDHPDYGMLYISSPGISYQLVSRDEFDELYIHRGEINLPYDILLRSQLADARFLYRYYYADMEKEVSQTVTGTFQALERSSGVETNKPSDDVHDDILRDVPSGEQTDQVFPKEDKSTSSSILVMEDDFYPPKTIQDGYTSSRGTEDDQNGVQNSSEGLIQPEDSGEPKHDQAFDNLMDRTSSDPEDFAYIQDGARDVPGDQDGADEAAIDDCNAEGMTFLAQLSCRSKTHKPSEGSEYVYFDSEKLTPDASEIATRDKVTHGYDGSSDDSDSDYYESSDDDL